MAVIREFNCPQHGHFESKFSVCPHGCVDVERVFITAPALNSRRTKNIDATLTQMAKDYKLSDISNKKGTLAASVPQFQPTPLPEDSTGLVDSYMKKQQQLFGGSIDRGADGSYWAKGMSFQSGKATVKGDMDTILGMQKPKVNPRPVVQASYGTSADVGAASRK
jgi:hypothetical protein